MATSWGREVPGRSGAKVPHLVGLSALELYIPKTIYMYDTLKPIKKIMRIKNFSSWVSDDENFFLRWNLVSCRFQPYNGF